MGISRLDNFLKSTRGTIIYVDPSSLDATDSIENQGNSLTRPFKTIQRALLESARFSYQRGLDNDRFAQTTILLYPGEHVVDNRPGYIPIAQNQYYERNGNLTNDLPPLDINSVFDLDSPNNELFKLNSINGGVILPRGTSIVGLDLRKTKIRPKYVPDPTNDNIERSAIFRVTGACYLWQMSIFDGDPNGIVYKDYTANTFVPNYSHHKLTVFEYADGVNPVNINDQFLSYSTSSRTDLDMYYEKVSLVYGQASGRPISPDFPSSALDIQPTIDESRIVGPIGGSVLISDIFAGDGVDSTNTITVDFGADADTAAVVSGLEVDTSFRIQGITATGYNGQFVVSEKVSATRIKYQTQNVPLVANPTSTGATLSLSSDTVTSASPYVFNCSLRSVFGMCGLHADGSKATGFKSIVCAQFTGIGLQKDDNAFVLFNQDSPSTGLYDDVTKSGNETISNNSRARYKPAYRNFHLKISNNGFVQAVSTFAVGYSDHFVTESGGDISLTNSNSNFGAVSLSSSGFRDKAFGQDDAGYISHIYPPKEIPLTELSFEFDSIDVAKTDRVAGVGSTGNLYLYAQTNKDVPPENVIEGYRVGAKVNDKLHMLIPQGGNVTEYAARIIMDGTTNTQGQELLQSTAEKSFNVKRVAGINSIGSDSDGGAENVITLEGPHNFIEGESVRILSDSGQIPDGLSPNTIYHVITSGSGISTFHNIKLSKTLNGAKNDEALTINNSGGLLKIVSRVSDKNSGEIGHPIQFDDSQGQWYVNVATAATENSIYPIIVSLGTTSLGAATPRTSIKRRNDSRGIEDTLYRLRYVIPSDTPSVARPPVEGFILQESGSSIGTSDAEIQSYFGTGSLSNKNDQRNFRFISNATWSSNVATITTELPHDLKAGSQIELVNVKSTTNTTGDPKLGFNKLLTVSEVTSKKQFTAALTTDPGTFTNDTTSRTTALPYFKRKKYTNNYYVFRISEAQKYIFGEQDGIYYLTVLNASNAPIVAPFTGDKFSQPVKRLFPQIDRDNPNADPQASKSFVDSNIIGLVDVNDPKNSITKETFDKFVDDTAIGIAVTNVSSPTGTAHTIHTDIDHGLNRIIKLSIDSGGSQYGTGGGSQEIYYGAQLSDQGFVGAAASDIGFNATAKVTVSAAGTITDIAVMDGGSAYGIGNSMSITGITTSGVSGHIPAVVFVDSIYDNVGDVVRINGISSESYIAYNDLYRITGITTGKEKEFNVSSASSITVTAGNEGIGESLTSDAVAYLTGSSLKVTGISYSHITGIASVTTQENHGLSVDNKIRISGAGNTAYNGSFVVTENVAQTVFKMNVGLGTVSPTETSQTIFALPEGFASQDGNVTINNENISGRMVASYAGITTTLASNVNIQTSTFDITGLGEFKSDVKIGDYLQIENEIVRIKTTIAPGAGSVQVFRGVLGTKASTHSVGSVIRRIKPLAAELRRHSIIRASGHTFEYVGFGPGNYSTAFPDKHDREINPDEEILAQSMKKEGGVNFYTGMNDKGISYTGNRRVSTITGREEIFETPVRTIKGEDILEEPSINVINPVEGIFSRSIKVEGGPSNKTISEFNGPLVVNSKLTINSANGLETNNLFIQGDATISRNYTVGVSAPVLAGNPGNAIFKANPAEGNTWGYVYTTANEWRAMAPVSLSRDETIFTFDRLGIANTTPGEAHLKVGAGTSQLTVFDGVGIGTTANGFDFRVLGSVKFDGTVTDNFGNSGAAGNVLTSTGVGVSFVSVGALDGWEDTPSNDGIYDKKLTKVGIGTSTPRVTLEVGAIAGTAVTTMIVNHEARFAGIITANNLTVTGFTTSVGGFDIQSSTGQITAGIVTSTHLNVGIGSTTISTIVDRIGFGTASPREKVDVEGRLRTSAISEHVLAPPIDTVGKIASIDLNRATVFDSTLTSDVDKFRLFNIPTDGGTFTIKLTQDATGSRKALVDVFETEGGVSIPVYWPGGVVPVMTPTANRTDIYSYKFFSGANITSMGLYGVVGGQNFS